MLACPGHAHCEKPQPLALFYGSGKPFLQHEIRVPFELEWSISALERDIGSGKLSPLNVVEAIKTAMPVDWLAAHHFAADSLSISFSITEKEVVEVYKSALNAWGAADVPDTSAQPPAGGKSAMSGNSVVQSGVFVGGSARPSPDIGVVAAPAAVSDLPAPWMEVTDPVSGKIYYANTQTRQTSWARPLPAASLQLPATGGADESLTQGSLLLQLMQILTQEIERCSSSLVDLGQCAPNTPQTELSITNLAPLQSTLVSSMCRAAISRSSDVPSWRAFARRLPHALDHTCRLHLFRQLTQTTPEHLMALRQDHVTNVDREHLLDWAAAITAAMRGRRNPLTVQFSQELGFGEAITASFFSEVADSFASAALGMWFVHGDDAPEVYQSYKADRALLASNGLFPQPYCASHPMPPDLLRNFNLLGCIMGKALHDGRAFPLRISYALARCICGQELRFEDLGAFLHPKQYDCLSRLRAFVKGGAAFPADAVDCFGDFQLFCHLPDAASDRLVVCGLELVPDGRNVDLCEENAPLFLKAYERLFLGDGVALQIQALRDGFHSVVSCDAVSILGASGLLRELYCLEVPPFDEEDVKFGLLPVNGYTVDSPQFQFLIKSMLHFNKHERAHFLRWLRGSPSLPAGFRGLPQRIRVQGATFLCECTLQWSSCHAHSRTLFQS